MNLALTTALQVRRWVDDELQVLRRPTPARRSQLHCLQRISLWNSDLDKSHGSKVYGVTMRSRQEHAMNLGEMDRTITPRDARPARHAHELHNNEGKWRLPSSRGVLRKISGRVKPLASRIIILRFVFQPVRFGWRRIAKSGCRLLEL